MNVSYLGPCGTFCEEAAHALTIGLDEVEFKPCASIDDLFRDLSMGAADAIVVPVRNTLAGDYIETADNLARMPEAAPTGEVDLEIHLALGIHPEAELSDIRVVRSKGTALKECSDYLDAQFAEAAREEAESTAAVMADIMAHRRLDCAAIGSEAGLRLYGLRIVRTNIENPALNVTTFSMLRARPDAGPA